MLSLEDYAPEETSLALLSGKLRLHIGHFAIKVTSVIPEFAEGLRQLYGPYPASTSGGAYDYDVAISPSSPARRWLRRNASFSLAGTSPFLPMDVGSAQALFEWGINWTIGSCAHGFLILHAAVLERNDCGVLLAAPSGYGKSTLAAELSLQGWRLLSDEIALIDEERSFIPCAKPVSLKNQSIEIIRNRHPGAILGPLGGDTHKGRVAHLPATRLSVELNLKPARPRLIVFLKWMAAVPVSLKAVGSGNAALRLIDQSFNYPILCRHGFERTADLVDAAEAWELEYSSLDEARATLELLVDEIA